MPTMKAVLQERYGPPDTWRLADTAVPEVGAGEVLVRVAAAALNPYDWHVLRGDPLVARLFGMGLTKPKARIAGVDTAGVVESVGTGVRDLKPGDEVLGFTRSAFAEFGLASASKIVPKPPSLTMAQAAAIPMAGITALQGIRDAGGVQTGQRVLVNGAGGGVGTFAVQIATGMGAEVTGVCSTRNVELVRSLGAAHVIDYTVADFTTEQARYDVILDNVGNQPLGRVRRALAPDGTYVLNAGGSPGRVIGVISKIAWTGLVNATTRQRLQMLTATEARADLLALTAMVEAGTLTPVVDRSYPLAEVADGLRHIETGHARGKVVVTVAALPPS